MTAFTNVQAITFDVGGTLIEPWPSVGHVYSEVAARHGYKNLAPDKLNQNFAAAWNTRRNFHHTRHEWAGLVDKTFLGMCPRPPSQTFFPAIFERFGQSDAWRIHDDVWPTLDALASQDMKLAVVSNWDERLRPLLKQLRLDRYFEAVVVSCEVAFAKPSPVIFEEAGRKLGVAFSSILHVGDSVDEDVEGAKAAGCQALLLDRRARTSPPARIESLRELATLVTPPPLE
jgi:putative hydrolase of the HAD superfamily